MFNLKLNTLAALAVVVAALPSIASAQTVYSYQLVPRTVYEKKPVTVTRWVDETVTEKQQVTSYKPVWEKEPRERRQVTYKPVQKTSEREQRVVTYKPIVETKYREKQIEETTYETITEYRDENYVVRKPVVETQMREESYTVRKPVTENLIEVQRTTSFKPVLKSQTQLVPGQAQVDMLVPMTDLNQRPRVRRLAPGYYTDPATGVTVYRRGGLHWVQPSVVAPAAVVTPTLVPQVTNEVEYVPETVETRKPIALTRYVETVETRKVPVEVQRFVESVETRKVPVTVRKPTTTVRVEKIPYTETRYQEEVIIKKVPYTETTYEKVETVEPYEVEVLKWIPETKEMEVPRTIRRRVDYEMMQDVPRTVMMRIPLDICGNPIAMPSPVYDPVVIEPPATATAQPPTSSGSSSGLGSTLTRRVDPGPAIGDTVPALTDPEEVPPLSYPGKMELVQPKTMDETSERSKSILVPETPPPAETPKTDLEKLRQPEDGSQEQKTLEETSGRGEEESPQMVPKVAMPDIEPSQTGDEHAAERTARLNPPQ